MHRLKRPNTLAGVPHPSVGTSRSFTRTLLGAGVLVLAVGGCGGEPDGPSADSETGAATATQAAAPEDRTARLEVLLSTRRFRDVGREPGARTWPRISWRRSWSATGFSPSARTFQPVPLARLGGDDARSLALPSPELDFDTLPQDWVLTGEVNVIGLIPGSDPAVQDEYVVVGAHYDHVGVGPAVDGDSIYNGADDDGTGTVAVLEIARALVASPPRRPVVVLLSTAEEQGLLGTRWYIEHPLVPLEQTVADFQIEMIGRPDSLAGGFGRGWLTGYERTTMGDQLAEAGSPIVPDPRPEMRFFFRSDNLPFAVEGIPAHTLSSYNMHEDYHQPSDEVEHVDFAHMAALVDAALEAVRFLADGPRPSWKEGGREGLPEPR